MSWRSQRAHVYLGRRDPLLLGLGQGLGGTGRSPLPRLDAAVLAPTLRDPGDALHLHKEAVLRAEHCAGVLVEGEGPPKHSPGATPRTRAASSMWTRLHPFPWRTYRVAGGLVAHGMAADGMDPLTFPRHLIFFRPLQRGDAFVPSGREECRRKGKTTMGQCWALSSLREASADTVPAVRRRQGAVQGHRRLRRGHLPVRGPDGGRWRGSPSGSRGSTPLERRPKKGPCTTWRRWPPCARARHVPVHGVRPGHRAADVCGVLRQGPARRAGNCPPPGKRVRQVRPGPRGTARRAGVPEPRACGRRWACPYDGGARRAGTREELEAIVSRRLEAALPRGKRPKAGPPIGGGGAGVLGKAPGELDGHPGLEAFRQDPRPPLESTRKRSPIATTQANVAK